MSKKNGQFVKTLHGELNRNLYEPIEVNGVLAQGYIKDDMPVGHIEWKEAEKAAHSPKIRKFRLNENGEYIRIG